MFALGVDPGLSRCGYGGVRLERGRLQPVAVGHLTTDPADRPSMRLAGLLADLRALLASVNPDVVVVERVLFQANARTAMSVGQASGLAMAVAGEARIDVVEYSPNEVKQAVVGHGGASKQQVQRMVQVLLGLHEPPRPSDRADALALAICHLSGARLRAAAEESSARVQAVAGESSARVQAVAGESSARVRAAAGDDSSVVGR